MYGMTKTGRPSARCSPAGGTAVCCGSPAAGVSATTLVVSPSLRSCRLFGSAGCLKGGQVEDPSRGFFRSQMIKEKKSQGSLVRHHPHPLLRPGRLGVACSGLLLRRPCLLARSAPRGRGAPVVDGLGGPTRHTIKQQKLGAYINLSKRAITRCAVRNPERYTNQISIFSF